MARYSKRTTRKPRAYKKKRVMRRKVSTKPSLAIRRYVKRELSRQIENKTHQASYQMECHNSNTAGSMSNEFHGLIPITPYTATGAPVGTTIAITQGTGQASRIGNVIRVKRATLRGVMFPNDLNASTNPMPKAYEVCMWIFKLKDRAFGDELTYANSVINTEFLQDNNATAGITGELINLVQPVNKDLIHLYYKRVFKLAYAAGTNTGNLGNNDFKYNQKFSINVSKYVPKVIKYNDNTDMPSISHTYCLIVPFNADGTYYTDGQYEPMRCDWCLDYVYEDA